MPLLDIPLTRLLPYVAATAAACLMGLMGVFVRQIPMSDETIAFARFSLGVVFWVGFLWFCKLFPLLRCRFSLYPILSGVCIALCVLFYIKAIRFTTLANAAFLLYLGPLFAVAATTLFLRERLSLMSGLLLVFAFAGCALILGFDPQTHPSAWHGNLFAVLAALWYALFIVANRMIPNDVTLIASAFYQLLVGAMVLAPFIEFAPAAVLPELSVLFWAIALGFLQGFLAVTLMVFAIASLKAYQYGTIAYLEPVVASLAGMVLYHETLLSRQALGGFMILCSGIMQTLLAVKTEDS